MNVARHHISPLLIGALALATITACSDEARDAIGDDVETAITEVSVFIDDAARDAAELAARNFAALQAEQEFEKVGHQVTGDLICEADATDSLTSIEITCEGETEDGSAARMHGTTDEFPGASFNELQGQFIGEIDGTEVFRVATLGN
ncbi:MAG: hypothetical protein EA389_13240 [Ilumatobacter sp.]|nr:MAG: hypothetical protein EA389_13240 [Ilumatobacter sp.]